MGSVWSADDYHSDWERAYVTKDHNGSTVCHYGSPFGEPSRYRQTLTTGTIHTIPLLQVHGVFNVGNLRLSWDTPVTSQGAVCIEKTSGGDASGGMVSNTIPVPEGATELDLDGMRAAFVAYLDSLVCLKLVAYLPGVSQVELTSELLPTPERDPQVSTIQLGPEGNVVSTTMRVADLKNRLHTTSGSK